MLVADIFLCLGWFITFCSYNSNAFNKLNNVLHVLAGVEADDEKQKSKPGMQEKIKTKVKIRGGQSSIRIEEGIGERKKDSTSNMDANRDSGDVNLDEDVSTTKQLDTVRGKY
jgi:hypothetical protein